MYENACKLMAKQAVALEVLSFHATAPSEDAEKLAVSYIFIYFYLISYTYGFMSIEVQVTGLGFSHP